MAIKEPNHICKNPKCTKGSDGGRKHYYACNHCDRVQNYRSVACSWECYLEYQEAVIEARTKGNNVSTVPERTDMTEEEVNDLLNKPLEIVLQETKEELKDYIDPNGSTNFAEAVAKINDEISKTKSTSTRTRKKKVSKNE